MLEHRETTERTLVTVENTLRHDVTRSQVRAGFARGVITEEQVSRFRLVETFLFAADHDQQATLELMKTHEHAMLSVERGVESVLTNGQVDDLVKYSLGHASRLTYGTGLLPGCQVQGGGGAKIYTRLEQ